MTDETVVAVYDTLAHAEAAIAGLMAAGVPANAISHHAETAGVTTAGTVAPVREQGFWSTLFGGEPDHDTAVYDRSLASGSTVVTVKVREEHIAQVTDILESHHPIDIDDRAVGYGLTQTTTRETLGDAVAPTAYTATAPTAATASETIQLAEESLSIGKRVVNRGSTRIRRFVVETPVEQNISLHSERVVLDRRPVADGRPVAAAAFTDKTIEVTETEEEAVVAKTARVVEEINLRKEATDRVETVRDTVRKEQVEIEQIPGDVTARTTKTGAATAAPRIPKV